MKTFFKKLMCFSTLSSFIVLAACTNPFAPEEGEKATFTISVGTNNANTNNSRAVTDYPPKIPGGSGIAPDGAPELSDLSFSVTFTPILSGKPKTFGGQGNLTITGSVDTGDYTVTMDVTWGTNLYAQGCAVDNPVHITGGGTNDIWVWVYSVDDAAMPLISANPKGADYALGAAATALTVDASSIDGGTLEYQWYSNTTHSNSGGTSLGTANGANTASYTPSTATAGTTYYYVEVANKKDGNTTTIKRGPVAVNVGVAKAPTITTQPKDAYYSLLTTTPAIAPLTVAATISDGGALSYQWYSNTAHSNSGGSAIAGATSASFTPPETPAGTKYYYAVVTNTIGANTASIKSAAVIVIMDNETAYSGAEGSGTENDPFIVHDAATLQRVGKGTNAAWTGNWARNAYYKQVRHIDMSGQTFTPIGSSTNFTGVYDGGGYTISNLKIDNPSANYQGLFGYMGSNAIVKNVGIVNCDIAASSYVGGVVGSNASGTVENCYATGNVTAPVAVGGVVGGNTGGRVQNCYSTCTVTATGYAGGVAGSNVENCYATGNVSCSENDVGGVVGNNASTVKNCYSTCNVSGYISTDTAGLVANSYSAVVKSCVALNPNIRAGYRVIAENKSDNTLTNNYGRNDMTKGGSSTTWTPTGDTTVNGADITLDDWKTAGWWTGTAGFDSAVWDFSGISATRGPTLKGMPGGAQEAVIQN